MMKIIHIMECFAGGTFTFLVELIKKVPEHQYIIIHGYRENTPKNFTELFLPNVTFIEWKSVTREISIFKDFLALKELIDILKNITEKNVIHLHSSKAGFLGRIAAKIIGFNGNLIYTPHGISFLRKDISNNKKRFFVLLELLASKLGGTVVGCSKSERDVIYSVGIKNVITINNGIDVNIQSYSSSKNDVFIIITAGRITSQKNAKLFNEIASCFIEKNNIRFVWCGDGEDKHYLTSTNIQVTGWITEEQVQEYIQKADVYLSTSQWEGLPLAVLKAMALGKALVLSDSVGNVDCINGNGKIFHNSSEAILIINNLQLDKHLLEKWSDESRKLFHSEFTLDKMVDKYLKLYLK
ncbi:MAG: glycosyltransferase [Selenomonadaceae bacterium]|nr:glycosyltransferase [Selenomonadaceae bacterium]